MASKKQRFPLAKIRPNANNNPFQFIRNDYSELSFKPRHYHKFEINPFEGEGRVPSKKDEDIVLRVKQGLKYNKNLSKSAHKIDNDDDSKNYLN